MTRYLVALLVLLPTLTSLAEAQVRPQRIRVGDTAMVSQIVKQVTPAYPPQAKQAHIQGAVILRVQISELGDVENIELISGHPMLAPAAIEAVKQWKYKPYLLNGVPVKVETKVTVNFTLSDKPAAEGTAGDHPGGIPAGDPGGIAPSNAGNPPHPPVPQRVRVSFGVLQALIVTKVQPQYPEEARHIQGMVVLKVIVDKEGNVSSIQAISGHPLLIPPAIEAVKQWKYKPFLLNGIPVEVESQVHVTFSLTK